MFSAYAHSNGLRWLSGTPNPSRSGNPPRDWADLLNTYAAYLKRSGDVVLHERFYGALSIASELLALRKRVLDDVGVHPPVDPGFVEGVPCAHGPFAGFHAMSLPQSAQPHVAVIHHDESSAGVQASSDEFQYLFLSDISRLMPNSDATPSDETRTTFSTLVDLLGRHEWSIADVKRTWFYLRDILTWYDAFNEIRNNTFRKTGIMGEASSIIPASTGIEGNNRRGSFCTLDVLAMRRIDGRPVDVMRVINPKQNEAPEYGSAFARALNIRLGDHALVLVSGTAAIDERGRSLFPRDPVRQIRRTLENLCALLANAEATPDQIVQATVFVKHKEVWPVFVRLASEFGFNAEGCVAMVADVCRPDLLFEMDATALLPMT